jgi:hypothetical protein
LPIESATFNGAAANAQNMANRVNTATNGKGTVYQSTHTTDLVGTSIGSNEPTGGLDSYGFPDSHSSYGVNTEEEKRIKGWGTIDGSRQIEVKPNN